MPPGDETASQMELGEAEAIPVPTVAVVVGSRVTYRRKLIDYQGDFETNVRNIKRWIAEGKKASPPDLPPLDEPGGMAAWWGRRMKQRVPAKLLALASCNVATAQAPPPVTSEDSRGDPVEERGVLGSIVYRLRGAEQSAFRKWKDALDAADPDEGTIGMRHRAWMAVAEQLRKAEKDAIASAGILGESINRAELAQILQPMLSSLATGFRQFLRRVRPKLSGLSERDQDAVYEGELNGLYKQIQENELIGPIG